MMRMREHHVPWLHLAIVTGMGVLTQMVIVVGLLQGDGFELTEAIATVWPATPGVVYTMLPIAAGASAALVAFRAGTRGRLIRLAMVATLVMLLVDLVAAPKLVPSHTWLAVSTEGQIAGEGLFDQARESVTRDLMAVLKGEFGDVSDRGDSRVFSADNPRLRASFAVTKAGLLLLPMIFVALAAGLLSWLQSGVVFTSVRHFRIVAIALAWGVSLGGMALATELSEAARVASMMGSAALTTILLPYVPLAILAWLFWRYVPKETPPVDPTESVKAVKLAD